MEERLEAPFVVPNPLPASADPHGLSAAHTRRLTASDRAIHRAVPVTFWHDACAPFRSAPGPSTSRPAARDHAPCGTRLHRPSLLIRFGDELLPSVSAALAVCDGLTRPPAACLSTVRGARARCVRPTSASHCFDYEHSRHIRSQHLFEACASPLRPGLAPRTTEAGGPGGSLTPDPLRQGALVGSRRFLPRPPGVHRTSDTPVASPAPSLRFARGAIRRSRRDRVCRRSVKSHLPLRSGMPSAGGLPRHARVAPTLENGHVRFPLRGRCQCFFARR